MASSEAMLAATNRPHPGVVWMLLAALLAVPVGVGTAAPTSEWPETPPRARPWAYWWWLGSAVEESDLTQLLEAYREAGFGGLHIIPIYGVRGQEEDFVPFLSPRWMELLEYTLSEAGRLGLEIDMTTGTGWPFGGPQVGAEHAAARVVSRHHDVAGDSRVELDLARGLPEGGPRWLRAVVAYSAAGEFRDLAPHLGAANRLVWDVPPGDWTVYSVWEETFGQQVERAAPGGEGNVMDFFSTASLRRYLQRFDEAFAGRRGRPRAFYNDSFEVPEANWTDRMFEEFRQRRQYDSRLHLRELDGQGPDDRVARFKSDFRETLSDLLLDRFVLPWTLWTHAQGSSSRHQAHGMPGNLLDLYAAADIPETEQFGPTGFPIPGLRVDDAFDEESFGKTDKLAFKFASSAAHVAGKPLVSSESATWLGEHFTVALSQVKPELDQLFLGGINHVFYHGIAYSPLDEPWPGRLFYASTNFAPSNPFWRHLPALNRYVARVQSILQSGEPDNDLLLYFPVHDIWHDPEGLQMQFTMHNTRDWLLGGSFHEAAQLLDEKGYSFDYVSDRQVQKLGVVEGALAAPGGRYAGIVLPSTQRIPLATFSKLVDLAGEGATVLVHGKLPRDVPGLSDLDARRRQLLERLTSLTFSAADTPGIRQARAGAGRWLAGDDLEALVQFAELPREPMVEQGLQFVRRRLEDGLTYFIVNLREREVDGWVELSAPGSAAVILDPLSGKAGSAAVRHGESGSLQVYLRLEPGESLLVRVLDENPPGSTPWRFLQPSGPPVPIQGDWRIEFVEGGPVLPEQFRVSELRSWTELGSPEAVRFAGTARYTVRFEAPREAADGWVLDLGRVAESARVRVNGRDLGVVFAHPFRISLADTLRPGANQLEVEVANLAANRIAELDRRNVVWRKFYEINFVTIRYQPFDASQWPPLESGLIGPVSLHPARFVP